MKEIKVLDLKESAFEEYRTQVKGNTNISFELAQKKLTRNVLLAAENKSWKNKLLLQREYLYGHLRIIVRLGEIIKVENHIDEVDPSWWLNQKKYIYLSRALGIKQDKYKPKKKKKVV